MKPEEIIQQCDEQIRRWGHGAKVSFVVRGRWGKRNTKRLWPGGPVGEILAEVDENRLLVAFSASEVKQAVEELMTDD